MAEMHVRNNIAPDSEWMSFVDGYLPGEPLDFEYIDDLQIIAAAQAHEDKFEAQKEIYRDLASLYAKQLLSEDASTEQVDTFIRWNRVCQDLDLLQRAGAMRDGDYEAKLEDVTRATGYPREITVAMLAELKSIQRKAD